MALDLTPFEVTPNNGPGWSRGAVYRVRPLNEVETFELMDLFNQDTGKPTKRSYAEACRIGVLAVSGLPDGEGGDVVWPAGHLIPHRMPKSHIAMVGTRIVLASILTEDESKNSPSQPPSA